MNKRWAALSGVAYVSFLARIDNISILPELVIFELKTYVAFYVPCLLHHFKQYNITLAIFKNSTTKAIHSQLLPYTALRHGKQTHGSVYMFFFSRFEHICNCFALCVERACVRTRERALAFYFQVTHGCAANKSARLGGKSQLRERLATIVVNNNNGNYSQRSVLHV